VKKAGNFVRQVCWAVALLGFLAGAERGRGENAPPSADGFRQDVYVWQRLWTPALSRGVREEGRSFAALDVLVAEVSFAGGLPTVRRAGPDWAALAATGRRIGLVVRSGSQAIGPGGAGSKAEAALAQACTDAMAEARGSGIDPFELQLDLDAATSRLPSYRGLLHRLREKYRPMRMVVTVLPDWLLSPDFAPLMAEADAYVLQVHSLERPVADRPFVLCDPLRTERWIREASALGIPYWVALPTYGYRVAFGPSGEFLGLQAEGPPRAWPDGSAVRTVMADPGSMAALVRRIGLAQPKACEGLIWFRFPSDDDRLAWHWPTLKKVMRGEAPRGRLVLSARNNGTNLFDLALANDGDAQVAPSGFVVSLRGTRLIAADAIFGWRIERGAGAVTVHPSAGDDSLLFPGERRQIGWMRLDGPAQIEPTVLP
jgi:hypothetical protein